jgi:hypothetical protein
MSRCGPCAAAAAPPLVLKPRFEQDDDVIDVELVKMGRCKWCKIRGTVDEAQTPGAHHLETCVRWSWTLSRKTQSAASSSTSTSVQVSAAPAAKSLPKVLRERLELDRLERARLERARLEHELRDQPAPPPPGGGSGWVPYRNISPDGTLWYFHEGVVQDDWCVDGIVKKYGAAKTTQPQV